MESPDTSIRPDNPAPIANREESLIALNMELTGASMDQARSVYAYLEADRPPGLKTEPRFGRFQDGFGPINSDTTLAPAAGGGFTALGPVMASSAAIAR
jgi:hypothetical protein